jgi:hypothetical protein
MNNGKVLNAYSQAGAGYKTISVHHFIYTTYPIEVVIASTQ